MILAARAVLLDARTWLEGGGLLVVGGRVRRVLRSRRAVERLRAARRSVVELDDLVLTAGLVNAHAHLDLCASAEGARAQRSFLAWIRAVIAARGSLAREELERGVRSGARALLATGTTTIGDIDATGASARLASELGPRFVVYREVLDAWDPRRAAAALRAVRRRLPARARVAEGLSPHAPYTTSLPLLRGARALAARRGLPLSIHWAETPEEDQWLRRGTGPFAALLPFTPRTSGLALLDSAGLLTPRTALVHGNVPDRGAPELLARRGVSLVHCPGTHAFFARPPFVLRRYSRAGVTLALGTDSLASNQALDMRAEMALLRLSHPELEPAAVLAMATEGGARALARPDLGRLSPGASADAVAWRLTARSHTDMLEELTSARPAVERVFVAGRAVRCSAS